MSRARAFAAERPEYLKLVRAEHNRRVTEAVRELDERLAAIPHDPVVSPATVGTIEAFQCPYAPEFTTWRYHGVGGHDIIYRVPTDLVTEHTDAEVRAFFMRQITGRI